jgi:NADH dehydrogenase [ubiquinone] 1 alpha subcomplex assembly factor 7
MAEQRTPLDAEIRRRIARDGPMSISTFMTLCLYDPVHGYYVNRDPLGAAGDFITAPEVSQMFGEMVGLWAAEVWQEMRSPDPVHLIELGPGRGTMMLDVLRAARTLPDFRRAARVHLVEVSPVLQQRQGETLRDVQDVPVRWHKSLADAPTGPAIVLANEFFDALPVNQAERRKDGWHERRIAVNAGGELAFTVSPEPLENLQANLPASIAKAAMGEVFEWRDDRWASDLARRVLGAGAALVIDYGHVASSTGDTFQAVRSHRFASPLGLPGRTDLTAHVDFAALARAAGKAGARIHGPVDQGTFLKRLGIESRALTLQGAAHEDKRAGITEALTRLVGSGRDSMGTLFKAMAISGPRDHDLPGFAR